MSNSKIARFVIWICKHFSRDHVLAIANGLLEVLKYPHADIHFKDEFKEENPNYRSFDIDPKAPLSESPKPNKKKKKR